MLKILVSLFGFILGSWFFGLWIQPPVLSAKTLIHEFLYISGLLAWGAMTLAIVIAARPAWIEHLTKTPLDQLYKWHRHLGIFSAVMAIIHWQGKPIAGFFLRFFTLEPYKRQVSQASDSLFDYLWALSRQFADFISEPITYGLLFLIVISFIKVIDYNRWFKLHKLFSILYIVLAIHCLRLMDPKDAYLPFGWLNIAITMAGVYYCFQILFFGSGKSKRITGKVLAIEHLNDYTVLTVQPSQPLRAQAGQFFFLSANGKENHPFSLAGMNDNGSFEFIIKKLGDFTNNRIPQFQINDKLFIEGPWGHFLLNSHASHQLWVASGVGIVPFMSWMQTRSKQPSSSRVDILWCVKDEATEPLLPKVQTLCHQADVHLQVFDSKKHRLNVKEYFETQPLPNRVAICAQPRLLENVQTEYQNAGGHPSAIFNEHFLWR